MDYKLHWSEEAVENLESIINYLNTNWTEREVSNFKTKLAKQLDLICKNPFIFPRSSYQKRLRKAVLSRQTTIFYEVKGENIYLAYIFVNKMDITRLK